MTRTTPFSLQREEVRQGVNKRMNKRMGEHVPEIIISKMLVSENNWMYVSTFVRYVLTSKNVEL